MMYHRIDKPVPLGCVVFTVGLLLLGFACYMFYGAHLAFSKDPPLIETGKHLRSVGFTCLIPTVLALVLGVWRVIARLSVKDKSRFGNSLTD
jgi:hypothetical protein